jgi:hypothetical protein
MALKSRPIRYFLYFSQTIFMKAFFSFLALIISSSLFASTNDTVKVRVHNAIDMTWYGSYNQVGNFGNPTLSRKVLMTYTMGCASTGCSGWDYTTQVFLRHRTGTLDTVVQTAAQFTVDGQAPDSLSFSTDTTFTVSFDSLSQSYTTTANAPFAILVHGDSAQPFLVTDTIWGWPFGMVNPVLDSTGVVVDYDTVYANAFFVNAFMEIYSYPEHIEEFELGRVITPYGTYMQGNGSNGYNASWKHKYLFDVTDYQSLLRDSVELRVFYSGYSSGFSVTLDFDFIEGTPPNTVLSVQNVYQGDGSYTNSTEFEANFLPAKTVSVPAGAEYVVARITPSGHGFDNNVNAAEFSNRYYRLMVNGSQAAQQQMWRDDCGFNPIFPQGGTWIYDRANWCPGTRTFAYDHDISSYITADAENELDLNIQNYTWSGTQTPSYTVQAQLISKGAPNFAVDAEVYDIISPSSHDEYKRMNPRCTNAIIVIRNNGASNLTQASITYGIEDLASNTFDWTGSLAPGDTAQVHLPQLPWNQFSAGAMAVFYATVSQPNGQTDQYEANNSMKSSFKSTERIASNWIVFWLKTNARADNQWFLYNEAGDLIFSRESVDANTNYKDTLWLANGCYRFELTDAGKDGLSWWANSQQGSGFMRFAKKSSAGTLKSFSPDFGSKIEYYFTLLDTVSGIDNEGLMKEELIVYPVPAQEILTVVLPIPSGKVGQVKMTDLSGRVVLNQGIKGGKSEYSINVEALPKGFYVLSLELDGEFYTRKIVIDR